MDIYFCNVNQINEDIESFVIAKNKIEQPLIDAEKIEKRMSIQEFLEYINLSNNIYKLDTKENDIYIPFEIFNTSNHEIIVIYSNENEKYDKEFKKTLKDINYNTKQLNHISQYDILTGALENKAKDYFIINNEYYIR